MIMCTSGDKLIMCRSRQTAHSWTALSLISAALILAGCVSDKPEPALTGQASVVQEPAPGSPQASDKTGAAKPKAGKSAGFKSWIGRNQKELVKEYGQPQQTLDVTLVGRPPSEAFLYDMKDGAGCLHAFVMVEKTGEIIDYFCR
ncbi:MAG: hypothetical protein H7833_03500 [Magnetococcus sp. DMHC-1]|nr:hypothetical protein [Magnetococcales bacterium]